MKILALPYGNSVAHTSRLLEIAKCLRTRGHDIIFAGHGKCLKLVEQEGFTVEALPDVPYSRIVEAIRTTNFSLLYGNAEEIEVYIQAELALYQNIQPDLVLSDDRRTALSSTTLARIPHVAVVNAHVTNYSQFPLLLPIIGSKVGYPLPDPLAQILYNLQLKVEHQVYNLALKGVRQARKKLGLNSVFAYQVAQGKDLTLIPDVPDFTPLQHPPKQYHYVGPITWQSNLPAIASLEKFKSYPKRAYLVLGSGGFTEFFKCLHVFEKSDFALVIAAGELVDQVRDRVPDNVFLEKYVNADVLLPHCDVIVCHGGNGTVYQALKHGVPVIGVPSHNEQDYNARRVQQLGLGKRLSHQKIWRNPALMLQAMEEVVGNPAYRSNARAFQVLLNQWDGPTQAADLIEQHGMAVAPRLETETLL